MNNPKTTTPESDSTEIVTCSFSLDQFEDKKEAKINDDDDDDVDKDVEYKIVCKTTEDSSPSTFCLTKRVLCLSQLFTTAISSDKQTRTIEIKIDSEVFENIVPYLKHHNGVPPPPITGCKIDNQWDATFAENWWNKDRNMFYRMTEAANYLDISCLLHLMCYWVGSLIQNKERHLYPELLLPPDILEKRTKKN